MEPTLLIVSDREDFAADYLIIRLLERKRAYYRMNGDEISHTKPTFRVGEGKVARHISCGPASVDLDRVSCVWYRRALRPRASDEVDADFQAFASAELRHLYEGLIAAPALRWINPPDATELAERKIYQLRIAERHGLRVAPTLVSTDPEMLQQFAAEHEQVVCKSISHGLVRAQGEAFAVHTHEVSSAELSQAGTLGGVPLLLQRCVPKGVDIRVTIIGDVAYPIEITTPPGAPIDWRATREGLSYRICDLPVDVEKACRSFMCGLRLLYGAFDFIRTNAGEWYFLEVNPAGEWAWLDLALGLSMRDSLIDLLYGS